MQLLPVGYSTAGRVHMSARTQLVLGPLPKAASASPQVHEAHKDCQEQVLGREGGRAERLGM